MIWKCKRVHIHVHNVMYTIKRHVLFCMDLLCELSAGRINFYHAMAIPYFPAIKRMLLYVQRKKTYAYSRSAPNSDMRVTLGASMQISRSRVTYALIREMRLIASA